MDTTIESSAATLTWYLSKCCLNITDTIQSTTPQMHNVNTKTNKKSVMVPWHSCTSIFRVTVIIKMPVIVIISVYYSLFFYMHVHTQTYKCAKISTLSLKIGMHKVYWWKTWSNGLMMYVCKTRTKIQLFSEGTLVFNWRPCMVLISSASAWNKQRKHIGIFQN